ncbi:NAD(P)-dependent oxidoreductase [Salinicola endophyticus]|uniref:NAD(P)-dependent oxidoreductase n=1 Tax=Salinicola endophyticus TaxID=1949083 RepID=A0ABY8FJF1_9GAMM|nr:MULTISPECIES: NAD(P)-dependent oxidoreductase [Salinicola]WFF42928.1 NAD(P)-dependent oxidoreductase [Salinicola endophyticus]
MSSAIDDASVERPNDTAAASFERVFAHPGKRRVGMIGLGNMGMPMAHNLLAAEVAAQVSVYGRSAQKLAPVIDAGAALAETPRALAAASDVLITVLPDLDPLRELLWGEQGIVAGVGDALLIVICSTSSPQGVRELAAELEQASAGRIRLLDAPLSGGTDGAEAGRLSIMVGGDAQAFTVAQPLLASMGNPVHLGSLGAGEVAKACNQMVVASTMVALSEATVIAERAGLDVARLLECLGGGYAGGRLLEARKQRLIDKDYTPTGVARYMIKDLAFARDEAARGGVMTPQLATLSRLFDDLGDRGLGEHDLCVTQRYIDELDRLP